MKALAKSNSNVYKCGNLKFAIGSHFGVDNAGHVYAKEFTAASITCVDYYGENLTVNGNIHVSSVTTPAYTINDEGLIVNPSALPSLQTGGFSLGNIIIEPARITADGKDHAYIGSSISITGDNEIACLKDLPDVTIVPDGTLPPMMILADGAYWITYE